MDSMAWVSTNLTPCFEESVDGAEASGHVGDALAMVADASRARLRQGKASQFSLLIAGLSHSRE